MESQTLPLALPLDKGGEAGELLLAVHQVVDQGVKRGVQHPFLEHSIRHQEVEQQELPIRLRLRLVMPHRAIAVEGELDAGALLAEPEHSGANPLKECRFRHLVGRHDREAIGVELDDVLAKPQFLNALERGVENAGVAEVAEFHEGLAACRLPGSRSHPTTRCPVELMGLARPGAP